jgi:titin
MTVKWKPPASDGGMAIFNYILEKQDNLSTPWIRITENEISATEFTVSGLTEGAEYQYRVSAENKAGVGEPSPPSEPKVVKPACGEF